MKRQPIGVDDFKDLIDNDLYFVDKTLFIKEIINDSSKVILITRPRRFGKTLNMSLLKYYFEKTKEDRSYLFKNYKIWQQGEKYLKEYNKYPVINLTFKGVKTNSWDTNLEIIKIIIKNEFQRHSYLLDSDKLTLEQRNDLRQMASGNGTTGSYIKSMEILSKALYLHHAEKPIILLDEYDTLLNEAYIHGYWKDAINFMKPFMNESFKNNIYLHKAIITGIFRVAKESIFSDMNNLNVYTILSDEYTQYFGFTQEEVEQVLDYCKIEENIANVAEWYNGYIFGKKNQCVIYNPWSIMMYAKKRYLEPYWVNTSGNEIIKKLATEGEKSIQLKIQDIIQGGTIERVRIEENIIYNEITKSENSIWSFMLMSGYLKSVKTELEEDGIYCTLKAPNKEVYYFFRNMLRSWFTETIKDSSPDEILKALLSGDIRTFYKLFANTVERTVSYFDVGYDKSESFYHAFVLGMLVHIEKDYEVRSNRESGYGRYDVLIIPKDKSRKGIIIEFEKVDKYENETINTALEAALKQIEEKKYETELTAMGIDDIIKLGIAFKGKEVKMDTVK